VGLPLGRKDTQDDGMCVWLFQPMVFTGQSNAGNPSFCKKTAQSISDVMSVMQDEKRGNMWPNTKDWAEPWPFVSANFSTY